MPNSQAQMPTFLDLLGGEAIVSHPIDDWNDTIEIVRAGIPRAAITRLAEESSLSGKELARFLQISERTLQRYIDEKSIEGKNLDSSTSEKLILIAKMFARGYEVFGDRQMFKDWLQSEITAFGGKQPITLLDTSIGIQVIMDELGRIEHGVYS
jgi:putative toxin-antitoxin system antitoxin component (TIGR02293 family)